jgi:surface carbohydrate biosynthesis protein
MSRPRIVIRAFTLRRDIATALLLAHQLEERGCEVIVASGRDFVRTMRFWKPDVAVINTVGQIERCAQLAPDASIIMLSGEGANSRKHCDAIHLVDKPGSYERVDKYLLWGKATERYFHEILPAADHSRLVVCGSPRLDLAKYSPRYPRSPSDQKTVGFIGRYHILNRYNAVPAIFSMQRPEKLEGALWQVENFFCMITIIRRIIEETDLMISLRPHPLEAPEGYSFMNEGFFKGRVKIDDSLDVADWTARQRVIVAPSSQSFYEAYVLGVPIINVDPLTGNADRIREINPNASLSQKVSYTPTNYDEAMKMVTGDLPCLPPVPEIDDHLEQFHEWFAPESATRRVVDEIVGVAQDRRRSTLMRMPSAIMNAWDRVSFRRVCAREPLHSNFSYHRHHHSVPEHLEEVIANIDANNSILKRGEQTL